jgi:DNA-binding transcriptional MerR regulator
VTEASGAQGGLTIDDLARMSEVPVRTIREYQTMRLLPPPERQGRVGIYGHQHVQRLELIARLQRRGYSLAGIRDLLEAWAAGEDLTALLGFEPGQAALDEVPLRLTRAELTDRIPALSGPLLEQACASGLVHPAGDDFAVRSPALVALLADTAATGVPPAAMLAMIGTLSRGLSELADLLASQIAEQMVPAVRSRPGGGDVQLLLQRGRLLLIQGAASLLADRLGAALRRRADDTGDGRALRAALEAITVGAVIDSAGHVQVAAR